MGLGTELQYASLNKLSLDPTNPRLGRNQTGRDVSQEKVLELMQDWTLDELARSYLESGGFWTQEALLVVKEKLYGKSSLVVVEGNRRLAALIFLQKTLEGKETSKKWIGIIENVVPPENLFKRIPYLIADNRHDVEAFLGFRHVTGIKEWRPAEKAEFIAKLIDERGMTYEEVRRKIGSKTPTVRQNYIANQLAKQIEDTVEDMSPDSFERRFSVMYLALRTSGVQKYLSLNIKAEPDEAKQPVPQDRTQALHKFTGWIFGTTDAPPLFTDSRKVDDFGRILNSDDAIEYLERTNQPKFEVAHRIAGGDENEVIRLIQQAADNVELGLSRAHFYKSSPKLQHAVERLAVDVLQLLTTFPDIRIKLLEESG